MVYPLLMIDADILVKGKRVISSMMDADILVKVKKVISSSHDGCRYFGKSKESHIFST